MSSKQRDDFISLEMMVHLFQISPSLQKHRIQPTTQTSIIQWGHSIEWGWMPFILNGAKLRCFLFLKGNLKVHFKITDKTAGEEKKKELVGGKHS